MSERFFITTQPAGDRAVLEGDEARHLTRVLRAKVGDTVSLFDGTGREWPARVASLGRDRVELDTGEPTIDPLPPAAIPLTLAVALPKGDRQKWMVEKLTELGASRLVPLETTSQLLLGFEFLDQLPREVSRAGQLLRRMLPHAFRAHRQILGSEGIWLHDVVSLVALTNPELFERTNVAADVETAGDLTAGMLVIDRRQTSPSRPNCDLLVGCDAAAITDCILRSFAAAAAAT